MSEEKTEIEIVNSQVKAAIDKVSEKTKELEQLIEILKKNQKKFYEWDRLEKGVETYLGSDDATYKALQTAFKEGSLRSIIIKVAPLIKAELKEAIDSQTKKIFKLNG